MTVRFGNVLGSSGSVVPLFSRQITEGGPITVTHPEMRRFFMTIGEASGLVLQACAQGLRQASARGEIFVLDMGEQIRIVDLARQMLQLAGKEPNRDIGIEYVGLRPGEKLYEELFDDSERQAPGPTEGLLVARSTPYSLGMLNEVIDQLEDAAFSGDTDRVFQLLARVVPRFEADRHANEEAA
jgi:FlaA1/EpsC-like NDP-sugar epimerase